MEQLDSRIVKVGNRGYCSLKVYNESKDEMGIFLYNHPEDVPLWEDIDENPCDEIVTNSKGGKQSKIHGKVMAEGLKRYPRMSDGSPNWHLIDHRSNMDHALEHAYNFLNMRNYPGETDKELEELSHFAARALMALEMFMMEDRSK